MGKGTAKRIATTAEMIARQQGREMEFQKTAALISENQRLVRSLRKMLWIAIEQKGLGRLAGSEIAEVEAAKALIADIQGVQWP